MTLSDPPLPSAPRPADAGVIYEQSSRFVAAALHRCLVHRDDIPDLVHDVFVVVHRRLHTYDPAKASVHAWLYGIARKTAENYRRRHRNGAVLLLEDAVARHPAASDPEHDAVVAQEIRTIEDAAAGEDDDGLDLLLRAGLDEKTDVEIGAERELSPGAVRGRLFRMRKRIKEKLHRRALLDALRSPVVLVLLLLGAAVAIARSAGFRAADLPTAWWPFHQEAPPAPSVPVPTSTGREPAPAFTNGLASPWAPPPPP